MWKESYRLGVDLIDKQHMELFKMVEHLIDVVQNDRKDKRKECIASISYMKDYSLQHFKDEEDYQESINYFDFAEHKDIHQKFTKTIMNHEKKMIQSNFDERHIKDFMGTLIAWLVYHVAGTDQQIKAGKRQEPTFKRSTTIDRYFSACVCEALNKIMSKNIKSIDAKKCVIDDLQPTIAVKIYLSGYVSGKVTFKYTKQLAFELMKHMASIVPQSIDVMVCSAMSEISNIISSNAVRKMASAGFSCHMNAPVFQVHPAFLMSEKGIVFDTDAGILEMAVSAGVK